MYKNIIFDIGNVLLDFKPREYLGRKIREADKVSQVYSEVFESKEWLMLDRGTITEKEAKDILIKNSEKNGELIELVFENWYEILTPIKDSIKVLEELKNAKYKLYFLSNFHLLAFEYVVKKYDFFGLFDGGVVSYQEKLLKPEERIYKRMIENYNINPKESIFIDDVQDNVEGAEKLKFNGILFTRNIGLREQLKNYSIYL